MNLTIPNDVIKAHRPSRITVGTHEIFCIFEVNGP